MKTSLIMAALAWSWAVEASGRAAEKDGNKDDPEKRARSRSPRRTVADAVAEPKGPAPKANGKAKKKYAPQNMNALCQQSAEEKERSKPSISTIHSKATTETLLSGKRNSTTESKAAGSKAPELKMAFECGPGGSLQVHGLWLRDREMETEKSARDKSEAMWKEFYTAAKTSGSTEEARTLRSCSPWLWKGTVSEGLEHLQHEWSTHGQYVIERVEGFKREGSTFVTRYLQLMREFRDKAYKSGSQGIDDQKEKACKDSYTNGRRFYTIHVCGTMEEPATWRC